MIFLKIINKTITNIYNRCVWKAVFHIYSYTIYSKISTKLQITKYLQKVEYDLAEVKPVD